MTTDKPGTPTDLDLSAFAELEQPTTNSRLSGLLDSPRRSKARPPDTKPSEGPAEDDRASSDAAADKSGAQPEPSPATRTTRRAPAKPPKATGPAQQQPEQQVEMKASAVHIPADLLPRIKRVQAATGLKNGPLLVVAIRDCLKRGSLGELIGAEDIGGDDGFASYTVNKPLPQAGPTVQFTVYMPEQNFQALDDYTRQFGARSWSRLATVALTDYLDHSASTTGED